MMTVETGVMRWAVFTPALMTSSDVQVAGVSQGTGPVMVTMTAETSVMKHISIVQKRKLVLLLVASGMNFSAVLMETASLICGAVMERKTVRMAVMRRAAMVPFDCVTTKPSFPAGVQGDASTMPGYVMEMLTVKISLMKKTVTVSCVDHPSTLVLMTPLCACSQRNSAMGGRTVQMGQMKATFVMSVL